jgi:hypothetical protein
LTHGNTHSDSPYNDLHKTSMETGRSVIRAKGKDVRLMDVSRSVAAINR